MEEVCRLQMLLYRHPPLFGKLCDFEAAAEPLASDFLATVFGLLKLYTDEILGPKSIVLIHTLLDLIVTPGRAGLKTSITKQKPRQMANSHYTHTFQGLIELGIHHIALISTRALTSSSSAHWSKVHNSWEWRCHTVDRTNFLAVTTHDTMAPSLATSTQSMVPVQQSTTIKVMSEMVINYVDYQKKKEYTVRGEFRCRS